MIFTILFNHFLFKPPKPLRTNVKPRAEAKDVFFVEEFFPLKNDVTVINIGLSPLPVTVANEGL